MKVANAVKVEAPVTSTVPANVVLSWMSRMSAPFMTMSLPAPVEARVRVVPPVMFNPAVLVTSGVVTEVVKVGLSDTAIVMEPAPLVTTMSLPWVKVADDGAPELSPISNYH